MALRRAGAKESFRQRREHRSSVAPQLRAEILRPVEDPRGLEEVDAAVDLVHVVALAERIERELRGDLLSEFFAPSTCARAAPMRSARDSSWLLPEIGVQIGSSGSPGQPRDTVADNTQCTPLAAAEANRSRMAGKSCSGGPTISVEMSSVSMRKFGR